jgi:hypothetical protein
MVRSIREENKDGLTKKKERKQNISCPFCINVGANFMTVFSTWGFQGGGKFSYRYFSLFKVTYKI